MRFINRTVLFIVLLLSAFLASRVDGQSAPITEEEYWALVEETRADLRALDGKSAEESRIVLDELAGRWSGVNEVKLADGTRIPVDVSFFVTSLSSESTDLKILDGLLEALLKAHETYPQKVFDASDLDSLNRILLLPEFQWRPDPIGEWIQMMWDKFFAWLDSLMGDKEIVLPREPLIFAAVLILLAVLAFAFRDLFTDLVKETNVNSDGEESDLNLTSETAFRKAQSLSGQGEYRTAVRYLYLSSLLLMEERGILRYDRSRTNREYLRSVSSHPNLAKPLRSVVDVFDRVWYGFEPLDESSYKKYMDEVEELKEQKQ